MISPSQFSQWRFARVSDTNLDASCAGVAPVISASASRPQFCIRQLYGQSAILYRKVGNFRFNRVSVLSSLGSLEELRNHLVVDRIGVLLELPDQRSGLPTIPSAQKGVKVLNRW